MTTVVIPRMARQGVARIAPLVRDNRYRLLQSVLYVLGAVLLPLGLLLIGIGWYGASRTTEVYDQMSFLISGGLLGLGLTFAGGFLYFGAWMAMTVASQRESAHQLSNTMLGLTDAVTRLQGAVLAGSAPSAAGAAPVVAGGGKTVHRRDCALVAHRTDLTPIDGSEPDLALCRVCQPLD